MITTLYLARDILDCYKVFEKKPTKFFKIKKNMILFLNKNQIPIGNYYGLSNFLPALKLKPGGCMELKITETKENTTLTVTDRDVVCKIELI